MAEEEEVQVPLVWEETEERPAVFVNQFLIQHQPDEFVLSIGQLVPPPIIGSDEDRREQLRRLSYVPIRVVGRFGFTRRRLQELIAVLQDNLERHDATLRRLRESENEPD